MAACGPLLGAPLVWIRSASQHGIVLDYARRDNAFAQSFNSRVRQECLNTFRFLSLADVPCKIEAWRSNTIPFARPAQSAMCHRPNMRNRWLQQPMIWKPNFLALGDPTTGPGTPDARTIRSVPSAWGRMHFRANIDATG
jgi:hypothetical protein